MVLLYRTDGVYGSEVCPKGKGGGLVPSSGDIYIYLNDVFHIKLDVKD